MREMVVDRFAGGGGMWTGIEPIEVTRRGVPDFAMTAAE
jgi:hypothetical protein